MEIRLYSNEIRLILNRPVSVRRAKGTEILCIAGTVWLTVAGTRGDILLRSGERYLIGDHRLVVLEAIVAVGNASIRVSRAADPLFRRVAKPRLQIA